MLWLNDRAGFLPDAITQLWVRVTGRAFSVDDCPWLEGPAGDVRRIGSDFFERLAAQSGATVSDAPGLLEDACVLASGARAIDPAVADFYAQTAAYRVDAWSEWNPYFKPFGMLLAQMFSRRLDQLNVPLDGLDTSRGMTSRIMEVRDESDRVVNVVWVRTLVASGRTIYCGNYSTCRVPGYDGVCLRVSFPLPNGNATVILRPEVDDDGSLLLLSSGKHFGDPGFYFVLRDAERRFARYGPSMRERIRVYRGDGDVRTDHELSLFGRRFLRLHYRLARHG